MAADTSNLAAKTRTVFDTAAETCDLIGLEIHRSRVHYSGAMLRTSDVFHEARLEGRRPFESRRNRKIKK